MNQYTIMSTWDAMMGPIIGSSLVIFVLYVIAAWKLFTKAGEPGWKSIIPLYNIYVLYKICWSGKWFFITYLLSIVTAGVAAYSTESGAMIAVAAIMALALILVEFMFVNRISRAYGHGTGMGILLFFIPSIGLIILGLGGSKYMGARR